MVHLHFTRAVLIEIEKYMVVGGRNNKIKSRTR